MITENPPEIPITRKRGRGRPRKIRPLTGVMTLATLRQILLEKASSASAQVIDTVIDLLRAKKTIVVQSHGKTEVLTVPDNQTRLGAARLLGEWLGFGLAHRAQPPADAPPEPPVIVVRTQPSPRPVPLPSPPSGGDRAIGDGQEERQEHLAVR